MITKEHGIELMKKPYNDEVFQNYRELHYLLFRSWPCGSCMRTGIYRKIKDYLIENRIISKDE